MGSVARVQQWQLLVLAADSATQRIEVPSLRERERE
jgi:hypothetical protein